MDKQTGKTDGAAGRWSDEQRSSPKIAAVGEILSYGTTEGVRKAWDERGRGRHTQPTNLPHRRIKPLPQNLPQETIHEAHRLVKEYEGLKNRIEQMSHATEPSRDAKSTLGHMIKLVQHVGEWYEGIKNASEAVTEAVGALFLAEHLGAAHIVPALTWAAVHVQPVMHQMSILNLHLSADERSKKS